MAWRGAKQRTHPDRSLLTCAAVHDGSGGSAFAGANCGSGGSHRPGVHAAGSRGKGAQVYAAPRYRAPATRWPASPHPLANMLGALLRQANSLGGVHLQTCSRRSPLLLGLCYCIRAFSSQPLACFLCCHSPCAMLHARASDETAMIQQPRMPSMGQMPAIDIQIRAKEVRVHNKECSVRRRPLPFAGPLRPGCLQLG